LGILNQVPQCIREVQSDKVQMSTIETISSLLSDQDVQWQS